VEIAGTTDIIISYQARCFCLEDRKHRGANMTVPQTPNSAEQRKRMARLEVAFRIYRALVAQDPDRVITLCDGSGRVVARHDPRAKRGDSEIAS
jgi:hypothetical protein